MALECCDGHHYKVELVCDTKEDLNEVLAILFFTLKLSGNVDGVEIGASYARCEHGDLEDCEEDDNDYTCVTEE